MNRRGLLSFLAALPFVGAMVPSDGVALQSAAHPKTKFLVSGFDLYGEPKTEIIELEIKDYALKGEAVTCENGHVICEFVETVHVGQRQDVERQLGNWQQKKPTLGQLPLPVCEKCGAQFTLGDRYHFASGWRVADRGPNGLRLLAIRKAT